MTRFQIEWHYGVEVLAELTRRYGHSDVYWMDEIGVVRRALAKPEGAAYAYAR